MMGRRKTFFRRYFFKAILFFSFIGFVSIILTSVSWAPLKNIKNGCQIFQQRPIWYLYAKQAFDTWGVPIHLQLAFIYQESKFVADARPPRRRWLGIIPTTRPSSAYGYAQVTDATWSRYQRSTKQFTADRDDFEDVVDFIGWYVSLANQQLGLSRWDVKKQYLAYHEGHSGYKNQSYKKKTWLLKVSQKVKLQAAAYRSQLGVCKNKLEKNLRFWW